MLAGPFTWLQQPITLPLYGFLIALILPVAYFAQIAKTQINQRFNGSGGDG